MKIPHLHNPGPRLAVLILFAVLGMAAPAFAGAVVVPEPGTALAGLLAMGLIGIRRRRKG